MATEKSKEALPPLSIGVEEIRSKAGNKITKMHFGKQESLENIDETPIARHAVASSSFLWWFVATCAVFALTAPLLLTDLPPLGDYLNHLARMYVITQGNTDPVLARMYEVQWGVVPNLAMDL